MVKITTFYRFFAVEPGQVSFFQDSLMALGQDLRLRGLTIFGLEGINATLSGKPQAIDTYKEKIAELFGFSDFFFKDSEAEFHPFHDYKVKLRQEIVTLKRPDLRPEPRHQHLSPDAWNEVLKNDPEAVVVDARNDYEVRIGKFKRAINPQIDEFNEFPEFVKNAGLSKDKKILLYCTGGIRCEKAVLELEQQGFENVYQLEGGILNYLKHHPHDEYEGECFVFDYRVAVDQNLKPSQNYKLCPHCGKPGETAVKCHQCRTATVVCESCLGQGPDKHTCSKNCAHHYRMGHHTRRLHMDGFRKRRSLLPVSD